MKAKLCMPASFIYRYLQFDFCDQNCYHISLQVAEFVNVSMRDNFVYIRISILNGFSKKNGLREIPGKELRQWILEMDAGK